VSGDPRSAISNPADVFGVTWATTMYCLLHGPFRLYIP
jgi:hypothetical protein